MLSADNPHFTNFPAQDLVSVIKKANVSEFKFSGYLEAKLEVPGKSNSLTSWNLFFSRGKIVFSGFQLISLANVLSVLNSYLPSLRNNELVSPDVIKNLIAQANSSSNILMVGLLGELALNNKELDYEKFTKVIESHIVADAEKYLAHQATGAKLVSDRQIDYLRPIVGLEAEQLFSIVKLRQPQWNRIRATVPSLDCQIRCNTNSPSWKKLSLRDKRKIKNLVGSGKTIEDVRYRLGEDTLKIAQVFDRLIAKDLVITAVGQDSFSKFDKLSADQAKAHIDVPRIVIIDDSLVLLKQFASVIKALGYRVKCCNDALQAVDFLLKLEPKLIFIDVNMPDLSGFQLMKQIRLQPQLASVPLVILTAEKNIMNQQRAKWSKSRFLSKPLSSEDKVRFITELKNILEEFAPISQLGNLVK